jgi:RNA polymerase sigma-70 factor (ECF subfamily)
MQGNESFDIDVEAYYIRYGPMVLRRCRMMLKDEEQASDAMQEVFVKLILNKKRLKGIYPSSLLLKIATNVCLNIIRSRYPYQEHQDPDKEDILTNIALYDERKNQENRLIINSVLEWIFKREKKTTREIAVMHFVDRMTFKEIAGEVGLSVSGVRKRLRVLKERVKSNKEVCYGK